MSSPNIQFDTIPSSIRKPGAYMEFNSKLAVRTLPSNKQRLTFIGQRTAGGSVLINNPVRVFSDEQAAQFYGRGSVLHLMIKAAIRANRYAEITAVALDDAATSVAATNTLSITGASATSSGVLQMRAAGRTIQVGISSGQTPTQVANAMLTALAARLDLSFTAAAAAGVITCTARNKGTLGNDVPFEVSLTAGGLAAAVTQPSNGAVDPDITAVLALLFASSDEIIVTPYADQANLTALKNHLAARGDSIEQRGAVGVYAMRGTLSAATTLASQINGERLTGALLPASPTPGYEMASAFASVIAFEEDPARPLNYLELGGVQPPNLANRLSRTEQEVCLANGVTPLQIGPGEVVQIVRAITTYTTSAASLPDIAWLDLTSIRTMDYVRRSCRERVLLRFPRDKKAPGIKAKVRSELLDVLFKLEELGIVENVEANKDGVIVEDDSQDPNRLNAIIPVDIVNGLHVFAARLDLIL